MYTCLRNTDLGIRLPAKNKEDTSRPLRDEYVQYEREYIQRTYNGRAGWFHKRLLQLRWVGDKKVIA